MIDEIIELKQELDDINSATEDLFEKIEDVIDIKSKVLDEAIKEQINIQLQWEVIASHIGSLENKALEFKERCHSHAFSVAINNNNKILNSTEAKKLADCDTDYVDSCVIYNKIYKSKREIDGVLNTINTRKFMLKHITDSVIAGVNKHII